MTFVIWGLVRGGLADRDDRPTGAAGKTSRSNTTPSTKVDAVLDFETAHELFKTTFCLLPTAREYEAAINSFQFDESMALRIGRMVDDPNIVEMTSNKFPLVLVSTRNLSRRFVLHGIFTEHLHAYLEAAQPSGRRRLAELESVPFSGDR